METVDIISLQQCFLVQIQKCVVYLNVWKIISPVSSPTHPFLCLSLILLPVQSLTLLSLLPPCVKVLKPSNCHHWIWTVIIIWDQELLLRRSPGMDLCSSLTVFCISGRLPWDFALSSCVSIVLVFKVGLSGFSNSHVWVWELDYKESWAPKNWCFWTVVLEKTLESPLDCKEIQPVHPKGNQSWLFNWKDRCWSWNSNTLATCCGELTHLKRPWCWERLRAGEGDDRGWDGWMASPTQWTWVWVNSGSWW